MDQGVFEAAGSDDFEVSLRRDGQKHLRSVYILLWRIRLGSRLVSAGSRNPRSCLIFLCALPTGTLSMVTPSFSSASPDLLRGQHATMKT